MSKLCRQRFASRISKPRGCPDNSQNYKLQNRTLLSVSVTFVFLEYG